MDKNKWKKVKRWFSEKGKFSLFSLLIIIVITGFAIYFHKLKVETFIDGYFINLAVTSLGIFISVNIIDWFIKRREKREHIKNRIIDYLFSLISLSSSLKYMIPEGLAQLTSIITLLDEYINKQFNSFDGKEIDKIKNIISVGNKFTDDFTNHYILLGLTRHQFSIIKPVIDQINYKRERIYITLLQLLDSNIVGKNEKAMEVIEKYESGLSELEITAIRQLLHSSELVDDYSILKTCLPDRLSEEYMSWFSMNWYFLENNFIVFDKLKDVFDINSKFTGLGNNMPQELLKVIKDFNKSFQELKTFQDQLNEKVDAFITDLKTLQSDLIVITDF